MSWSERGQRPTEPGRYVVEKSECFMTFRIESGRTGLMVREVGLVNSPLESSCWDECRWLWIPDLPLEIPEGNFFVCKYRGTQAIGVRKDGTLWLEAKELSGGSISVERAREHITDIRILPEEFQ